MKSLKNEYDIIVIYESVWGINILTQVKKTGEVYIVRDLDHSFKNALKSYREIEDEGITSISTTLEINKLIEDKLNYELPSDENDIKRFTRYLLDKEKIKAKIKENNRQAKLNILL